MKRMLALAMAAGSLTAAAPALAQPGGVAPGFVPGRELHQQEDLLEQRIRNGVQAGQIDRLAAHRAFDALRSIRDEEAGIRARNGGQLLEPDRLRLQARLDRLSRGIHWLRQNGAVGAEPAGPGALAPAAGGGWSLDQREDWLQQRIDHGLADGSLDRHEAFRAQSELRRIRFQEQRLRTMHGGRLWDRDRLMLQQRLDNLSQTIHWLRDNGERRPW